MKKILLATSLLTFSTLFLTACKTPTPPANSEQAQNQVTTQVEEKQQNQFKGSLENLLGLGKQLKCTWQYEDSNGKSSGVIYLDGKRYKSEIRMSGPESITMYNYSDGEWVYSWGGPQLGENRGLKLKVMAENPAVSPAQQQEQTSFQMQAGQNNQLEYDYQCENWRADENVFTLPSEVQFSDLSKGIEDLQKQAEQMQAKFQNMN